jgi:hypothetical protein
MRERRNIRLVVSIFTAFALALILPGLCMAGSLEPSGPPGPTMRTLDEIYSTNSWSKKLPCDSQTNCPRFEIVMDGAGVLDKETGLVWEKSPSTSTFAWQSAGYHCFGLLTGGGRCGWRLPTFEELASLFDPTVYPRLPSGHPFVNVQSGEYWSATIPTGFTDRAWVVGFYGGLPGFVGAMTNTDHVWCVRGGQGINAP